jgi:hypothetical protein
MLAQPTTQTRDTDTGSPSSKKPTPPKEWIRRWKACARDVMRPRRNTKTFSTHHRTATPPTNYELRNDRYCNRARSILDSAKEKTSAATTLIKDATPAQLAVLVEELPAYMTAHSQPTSLINQQVAAVLPEFPAAKPNWTRPTPLCRSWNRTLPLCAEGSIRERRPRCWSTPTSHASPATTHSSTTLTAEAFGMRADLAMSPLLQPNKQARPRAARLIPCRWPRHCAPAVEQGTLSGLRHPT